MTEQKSKARIVAISEELYEILGKIKKNVSRFTWGAEPNMSNYKASKILAKRVNDAKLY